MDDSMMWSCLKNGFCSFKMMTKAQMLCKNDFNVTGICSKSACPLANSNYATIREHNGVIYLCKKVIERQAFPHKLWEKIKLQANYEEALEQIDVLLPYWNQKQVHRCKQRYTKIYQYLERSRKLRTKMRAKKLITLPRKMERREKAREKKALIAAKLENKIEMEIMNRVKQGVYGERYKFQDKNVFEKALVDQVEEEIYADQEPTTSKGKKRAREIEVETAKAVKLSKKYVEDIEDLGEDLEGEFDKSDDDDFWATEDENEDQEEEEWEREATASRSRKKPQLSVEWEK